MESLVPILTKLQNVFKAVGHAPIDLPQIVAIGCQSCGKSSVLEGIVGCDFLPRGAGVCTRRPLILELSNTNMGEIGVVDNKEGVSVLEYGEFEHLKGRKFYDFDKIRKEIMAVTEQVAGDNKGISTEPICLRIRSPRVLDLVLVDLPGITKNPIGDQPEDIEEVVRQMCLQYIANPNCIVLAVTPATEDLVNSDSLKLAREVDPEGTDACDALHGRIIPLELGFVGVVGRSQEDVNANMKVSEALKREKEFFAKHPSYRAMCDRTGMGFLSRKLNEMLVRKIRTVLPDIKAQISTMLLELQGEIDALGEPCHCRDSSVQGGLLLSLLSKFTSAYIGCLDGQDSRMRCTDELIGGARIAHIFNDIFVSAVERMDSFDGLSDEEIRTAIQNSTGTRKALFVPELAFDMLVKKQISRLERPAMQCVEMVFEELQRIARECKPRRLARFGALWDQILDVVERMLRQALGPTQCMISNLVQIELAHVNTNHPDFVGASAAVAMNRAAMDGDFPSLLMPPGTAREEGGQLLLEDRDGVSYVPLDSKTRAVAVREKVLPPDVRLPDVPFHVRPTSAMSPRQKLELNVISACGAGARVIFAAETMMLSYFDIVRKSLADLVPKTVMFFLVNHVKERLQSELVHSLYKEKAFGSLLKESDDICRRRQSCVEMKALLERALRIVSEVRGFDVGGAEEDGATESKAVVSEI